MVMADPAGSPKLATGLTLQTQSSATVITPATPAVAASHAQASPAPS
jgi:hypothetical protein